MLRLMCMTGLLRAAGLALFVLTTACTSSGQTAQHPNLPPQSNSSASSTDGGEAARRCFDGLRQATGYDQEAALVVAEATTAGALSQWHQSRGGVGNSQWSQRPTSDEPVTLCGYKGDFSSAPAPGGPPGAGTPVRTHLLFEVDAAGRFTPDRIGDSAATDVSDLPRK